MERVFARAQKAAAQLRRNGDQGVGRGRPGLAARIYVADLLQRAGLAASKGEARRLIRGGGARLNDTKIDDEALMVGTAELEGDQLTLSAGRKRHVRVRVV